MKGGTGISCGSIIYTQQRDKFWWRKYHAKLKRDELKLKEEKERKAKIKPTVIIRRNNKIIK